jgi:transcriptional regulator with XRE-family HTH domain
MTLTEESPVFDPKRIARRIRAQMQRHDLSVLRLARDVGVAQSRVEELVSGRVRIGPLMCAVIAPALRCTPTYLLTGKVAS